MRGEIAQAGEVADEDAVGLARRDLLEQALFAGLDDAERGQADGQAGVRATATASLYCGCLRSRSRRRRRPRRSVQSRTARELVERADEDVRGSEPIGFAPSRSGISARQVLEHLGRRVGWRRADRRRRRRSVARRLGGAGRSARSSAPSPPTAPRAPRPIAQLEGRVAQPAELVAERFLRQAGASAPLRAAGPTSTVTAWPASSRTSTDEQLADLRRDNRARPARAARPSRG